LASEMTYYAFPCHFCGEPVPINRDEFYKLLPSGFMDCGDCTKDWGILFSNPRLTVVRKGLLRRKRHEPPESAPMFFDFDEIPAEHSIIAKALDSVLAKANMRWAGNAFGDLLTCITHAGLGILKSIDWGSAPWLPPLVPPSPDDPSLPNLKEPWRSIANTDRALRALHGLFAGYVILLLVAQAEMPDGKHRLGPLLLENSFEGDADRMAGLFLPHFHPAGQRLYWAFRDRPSKVAGLPVTHNAEVVFMYPRHERAVRGLEDAVEQGLDIVGGTSDIETLLSLPQLFAEGFGHVLDGMISLMRLHNDPV
jgi:hypothetical protein